MAKLIILGTSNAIPDDQHENTHMALTTENRLLLIDCPNNPTARLPQAGLNLFDLTDLILTHFHPDHISGVPTLLMSSWLLGRKTALNVYGLEYTLDRLEQMMNLYEWGTWPDFFPIHFQRIPETEHALVLDDVDVRISSSPVHHFVPNISVRIEIPGSGRAVVYSSDTEPCDEVVRLASGADILIHEATGEGPGHTSAEQAGEIAQKAGVKTLVLIHYYAKQNSPDQLYEQAKKTFTGEIVLAKDFMELGI